MCCGGVAVLAGGGAARYCDLVDRSTVTAAVAVRTGVVVPVEPLVPATVYVPHDHARAGLPRIGVARAKPARSNQFDSVNRNCQ